MDDTYDKIYTLKQTFDCETNKLKTETFYNAEGLPDRGELPSLIVYDLETGKPYHFVHYQNGNVHRDNAPAREVIDLKTGVVTLEHWCQNDNLHRDGGDPAVIWRHHETGRVHYRGYYEKGRELRTERVEYPETSIKLESPS